MTSSENKSLLDFGTPTSNAKHAAFADLNEEDQIAMVKRGEI